MADKFSAEVRSKIMSRIKSKWTSSEKKVHNQLKGNRIRHVMHPKLPGNPDVFLMDYNLVLFLDGCFWHCCPLHGHIPDSNLDYWGPKIEKNVQRDLENSKLLKRNGFIVKRIWEHEVKCKEFNILDFFEH